MFKLVCGFAILVIAQVGVASPKDGLSYADGFIHTEQHSQCVDCHQQQVEGWHKSDHFKSMALPNANTVVGDFNTTASHYKHKAKFWQDKGQYKATFTEEGETTTYTVDYVFGYYPLQQYLTHIKDGHYQMLPFAWDDRPKEEGGKKWFHMYPNEEIKPADRLHWKTPIQNWNGMCADCHSDRLVRNYDVDNNSFNTTWDEINVGCLSCHGDISKQTPQQIAQKKAGNQGYWGFTEGNTTAHWQGPERDNSFVDNCYACHALRAPLTDGIHADDGFLNQFSPSFLQPPLYYPDGHIRDEVYVWGSFQQSKMFEAGVNCLDCHDSHSYKTKIEGNGLCLQCHTYEAYATENHHHHKMESEGAQCVECHMPESAFMVLDDRRDHSFRIPRPLNSLKYGTPNACTKCHEDKDDEWAAKWSTQWYGQQPEAQGAIDYMRVQVGENIGLSAMLKLAADPQLPPIKRASALRLLPITINEQVKPAQLQPFVDSKEPLLRIAVAEASRGINPALLTALIQPLLKDDIRAVRVAAASALLESKVDKEYQSAFEQAYAELVTGNRLSSWRGEGRANQGMVHMRRGEIEKAEDQYKSAIFIDPYFAAAYVNLTDLYRLTEQPEKAQKYYDLGIKNLPKDAAIRYSYGLYLIRSGKAKDAAEQFSLAVRYEPQNEQNLYVWLLTLDNIGQADKALNLLLRKAQTQGLSPRMQQLGLQLAQKAGNLEAYQRLLPR